MAENYYVYMHICPNGKVYIGITNQEPKRRWSNGAGYYRQKLFNNAIEKYGWKNIKHEILFVGLTKEQAEQKEIELIALYKSNQIEYRYNLTKGGATHESVSQATKEKMRLNNSKNKKVYQYSLDNKLLNNFNSTMEVERTLGINHRHISRCCTGKRATAYGFKWCYREVE